jgi:hypothetical protein
MKAMYEQIIGGTLLLVYEEIDEALLMKVYFLRKGCRVFVVHTLTDAFDCIGEIEPDVVIVLRATVDNNMNLTNSILKKAGRVQMIIVNGDITFDRKYPQI